MKRVHSVSRVVASISAMALLTFPAIGSAQTFYGLSAGLNASGPAPAQDFFTKGFALQASVGRQLVRGYSVRFDAFTSRFDDSRTGGVVCEGNVPCPSVSGRCCAGFAKPVGLASFTASGMINVQSRGFPVGAYLMGGVGAYYLYEHPTAAGALRPDLSAGTGVTMRVDDGLAVFLETRYYRLLNGPSSPNWLMPLTFGVRF